MLILLISEGKIVLACMYTKCSSFKTNGDKELWLLFFDLFIKWDYAGYYTSCNTGRARANIDIWIRLARANCSSLSGRITLSYLWDWLGLTVFKEKSHLHIYIMNFEWGQDIITFRSNYWWDSLDLKYLWQLHLVRVSKKWIQFG